MKVYVVVFEGSTEDYSNTDIFVCGDYYKAYDKFKELICNERNPDVSWVGNLDFDDDGEPIGHYELDFEDNNSCESEVWWHIEDTWDSRFYTKINLLVKEVE